MWHIRQVLLFQPKLYTTVKDIIQITCLKGLNLLPLILIEFLLCLKKKERFNVVMTLTLYNQPYLYGFVDIIF